MKRLGIDVGGTFTDLIMLADGGIEIAKVPTTPGNQAVGVLAAIAAAGIDAGEIDSLVHGTTTTTNALLERRTAKVGLVTTRGFRDILELGRRTRPQPYGMTGQFVPLIPRPQRLEVSERMDARGRVVTPLDEQEVETVINTLLALGCEALVIHFLHSYANPAHELLAGEIAARCWPNAYVTIGHQLLAEFREYERGTTASVNAAVQPVLDRYIQELRQSLRGAGYERELLVMQGNGGTLPADAVTREAIKTVLSGPASGVIAAAWTAHAAGIGDVISYDMGGTSSDVALVKGGLPAVSSELELEYALPVHVPMVDVHTIGAGGGSLASIDDAGILCVGPQSAGADPGPICYGRGGRRATITDANLVLGRLPADRLLAATDSVTRADVEQIIAATIGAPLGLSGLHAAAAILQIGNDRMAGAIRMVSLGRGEDPRDYALFAFGGAGPLHACALARELGIPRVLVPPRPGITNAIGCVVSDARYDFVQTVNQPLVQIPMADVSTVLRDQIAQGRQRLSDEHGAMTGVEIRHSADMQFRGQTHLLRVDVPEPDLTREQLQALFEAAYFERFAVRLPEIGTVLVNLNTAVVGRRSSIEAASLCSALPASATLSAARSAERPVWFDGDWQTTPIYDRELLPPLACFDGPAVIEQLDSTTVIEPANTVTVDVHGNLLIDVPSAWEESA